MLRSKGDENFGEILARRKSIKSFLSDISRLREQRVDKMSGKQAKGKSNQDGNGVLVFLTLSIENLKIFSDDLSSESVEVLRERLNAMKKLVADRQQHSNVTPGNSKEIFHPANNR